MFGDQADSDERALVYGAMITGYPFDNVKLRRAADAGNAFAQAWMAFRSLGPAVQIRIHVCRAKGEGRLFRAGQARKAGLCASFVLKSDRCFHCGTGCEKSIVYALENYHKAAVLGNCFAMLNMAHLLNETTPERWLMSVCFIQAFL